MKFPNKSVFYFINWINILLKHQQKPRCCNHNLSGTNQCSIIYENKAMQQAGYSTGHRNNAKQKVHIKLKNINLQKLTI